MAIVAEIRSGNWSKVLIAAAMVLATLAAMWPAWYNGQPIFFPDTTAYLRGVDAGMQKIFHVSTAWSMPAASADAASMQASGVNSGSTGGGAADSASEPTANHSSEKAVLGGRSVYYGTLLYLGHLAHGLWLAVVIQALLLVLTTAMVLRAFGHLAWKPSIAALSVMTMLTPAPLFASFLMPDLFAGIAILAGAMLIARGKVQSGRASTAWALLLFCALTFHNSHLLLALVLWFIGLLVLGGRGELSHAGLAAFGGVIVAAYAAGLAFNYGVARTLGVPPIAPPFLTARLIDDGPGYRYLRDTCPSNGFAVCRFIDRLPLPSDDFLWADDPDKGVFMASDTATKKALAAEQLRFAAAVLVHDPLGVVAASAHNAATQALLSGAGDFNYSKKMKADFSRKLPPEYFESMQHTRAFAGTMPVTWFSVTGYVSSIIGIVYLGGVLGTRRSRRRSASLVLFVWLSLAGVVANAAICGIFSGSHERYQARVIWLLPLLALLMHFAAPARVASAPAVAVNVRTTAGRIS